MSRVGHLARRSLVPGAMSLLAVGCIDPPPEYSAPERLPPVILTTGIDPPVTKVATISLQAQQVTFDVPFRSDDAGEDLSAFFVLDIATTQDIDYSLVKRQVKPVPADPRPFLEQDGRHVTGTWGPLGDDSSRPSGCHTMTMILSHLSNFGEQYETSDPLDVAQVTWWLDIRSAEGGAVCWPKVGATR